MSTPKSQPEFNWSHGELEYLANLTGVDCLRLKGVSGAAKLRKRAHQVNSKVRQIIAQRIERSKSRGPA